MAKTKIVATIGPATANSPALLDLWRAGMNVARLNGSHSDLLWHEKTVKLIKSTLPDCPILLDIPGRKIRTTLLKDEPIFEVGDVVTLTTDLDNIEDNKVPVNYAELHKDLRSGDIILADDGTLRFSVLEIKGRDIICKAEISGQLKSAKGINVPNVILKTKLVTEKDKQMIKFAEKVSVDFVGISFVESEKHVFAIRSLLDGSQIGIVSKIENAAGYEARREIIEASDVIMIDRGDLSVETDLFDVVLKQKLIIRDAQDLNTPVIVATELLHTMINNPVPTKAEVSDVTNAVIDGAAALMLSGETAVGNYPKQSVTLMRKVADSAFESIRSMNAAVERDSDSIPDSIKKAVSLIAGERSITKIIVITKSGFAARRVASLRPRQPILVVTNDEPSSRALNILHGTESFYVDTSFDKFGTSHLSVCLKELWMRKKISASDIVLVTCLVYPSEANRMNLIQVHHVSDLEKSFNW